MLHHVSVGVTDVERAARFYDSVLGALGYKRVLEILPYAIAYGESAPNFWIGLPHDHSPCTAGNGVHIGFKAKTKAMVESFHRAALEGGGTDEGAAGPRPDYGPDYYGAFVRDPDGNKLEAVLAPETSGPAKKTSGTGTAKRKPAKAKAKTKRTAARSNTRRKKAKAPAKRPARKTARGKKRAKPGK